MKDPADELTPELPQLTAWQRACEQGYRDSYGALGGLIEQAQAAQAQAVQPAVAELGAGPPKPRRVRKGGASKSAARSADKPERG